MSDWPFTNPVLTASGCGGTGRELAAYGDLTDLGGFVTRSVTLLERPGGGEPRIVESPSGLVNAIGLQNPGVVGFLRDELPPLVDLGAPVVVSIAGHSLGEYAELARTVGRTDGVIALEVNLSAPDPLGSGSSTRGSRSRPGAWSGRAGETSARTCCCWSSCAAT